MDFLHRCRFFLQKLYCFFLVVFLGDGRLEKGDRDFDNLCVFFWWVACVFWLAGVKGTAFLEQRPGMQTFFCGWKERCMKMVITTFKNVLSVAYLSPEQQRIAHIGRHFLWFPPRWRLLSL